MNWRNPAQIEDTELVGFDEGVRVAGEPSPAECGIATPIARSQLNDLYFKLLIPVECRDAPVEGRDPLFWDPLFYTSDQILSFREEGAVTLLGEGEAIPARDLPDFPQVAAVFALKELFDALGESDRPESFEGHDVIWKPLPEGAWAGFLHADTAVRLLDRWGKILLKEATERLIYYLAGGDSAARGEAERLASIGLCAASDRATRYFLYIRKGIAQRRSVTPERVKHNLYGLIFRREFPEFLTSWEKFEQELTDVEKDLRQTDSRHVPKWYMELLRDAEWVHGIDDEDQRRRARLQRAGEWRDRHPTASTCDVVERLISDGVAEPVLHESSATVLQSVPAFYERKVLHEGEDRKNLYVRLLTFLDALESDEQHNVNSGPIGERFLKGCMESISRNSKGLHYIHRR